MQTSPPNDTQIVLEWNDPDRTFAPKRYVKEAAGKGSGRKCCWTSNLQEAQRFKDSRRAMTFITSRSVEVGKPTRCISLVEVKGKKGITWTELRRI